MVKKVIFDLDNTLFNTKKDCVEAYDEFFSKYDFGIKGIDLYNKIDEMNYNGVTQIDGFYIFLKEYLGDNFTEDIFKDFKKIYISHGTLLFDNTSEVLEYLSKKYELYTLSNWFYEFQIGKLDNHNLSKYFKEIYTIDNFGRKPAIDVYKKVCEPYEFSECCMIGDSLKDDIIYANLYGMKTIYIGEHEDYVSIKNLDELKNIL